MPTIHFQKSNLRIVLSEAPTTPVSSLIAELAEVLVSTNQATQDEVAELRLGISNGVTTEVSDITEAQSTIQELNINEQSTVYFKYGNEPFN